MSRIPNGYETDSYGYTTVYGLNNRGYARFGPYDTYIEFFKWDITGSQGLSAGRTGKRQSFEGCLEEASRFLRNHKL